MISGSSLRAPMFSTAAQNATRSLLHIKWVDVDMAVWNHAAKCISDQHNFQFGGIPYWIYNANSHFLPKVTSLVYRVRLRFGTTVTRHLIARCLWLVGETLISIAPTIASKQWTRTWLGVIEKIGPPSFNEYFLSRSLGVQGCVS